MRVKTKLIVGFEDERHLVERFAEEMSMPFFLAQSSKYRAGEFHLTGPDKAPRDTLVFSSVHENPESLFGILLLNDALRRHGAKRTTLIALWMAYGRQDRPSKPGEAPAGLVVAGLLARAFDKIVTLDAHSKDFIQAFDGKLVNVLFEPKEILRAVGSSLDIIAAPDHGARFRAERVADHAGLKSLVLKKTRIKGKVQTFFTGKTPNLTGARILFVDDMADSGSTLIQAAKILKQAGASSVASFVTHAMDCKQLNKNLKPEISQVVCGFDHKRNVLMDGGLRILRKEL